MTTHKPPLRAIAWIPAGNELNARTPAKLYRTELGAWIPLARALVVAKYPPWLTRDGGAYSGEGGDGTYGADPGYLEWRRIGMSDEQIDGRARRARLLFHHRDYAAQKIDDVDPADFNFDDRRWKRVINRLAKFLRWRSGRLEAHRRFESFSDAKLHDRLEQCELGAGRFMDEVTAIRDEQKRRAEAAEDVELYFEGKPSNRGKP